ncbi:MAG: AAA family ATPase [Candidatus Verstraetearchaeota archaeon]|nr:AAA family ATPase [Candidatus Verstraetearchaeota archaeon]
MVVGCIPRREFPKGLVITISGPPGSGKSHCASRLAETYGVPCHSAGSIFRSIASERGLSLEELSKISASDPSIDREIDRRTEEYAKAGGCILEGRLVSWFSRVEGRLSFYLTAPLEVRAKRIAEREGLSLEEARLKTAERQEGERQRYLSVYGIDISDLSGYDFVINTSIWGKEEIVALLVSIIDLYIRYHAGAQHK